MELDQLGRTALVPFWARANDAVSPRPILGDASAAALAPRVLDLFGETPVDRSTQAGCCLRNLISDGWLTELADATTTIVEIGVGLNTRVHRLASPAHRYAEVDQEAIMRARDELVPAGGALRVLGDGMDVKYWVRELGLERGSRVVITLEGVLAYQAPEAVERFFDDAAFMLPGAYVVFDRLSPAAVDRANHARAQAGGRPAYRWPPQVEAHRPGGEALKILRARSFMDLPYRLRRHIPLRERAAHMLPPRRNAYQLLLGRLSREGADI
jgi:O-methyltransferase involved in polyketide biosynthesis